jgi:hypothetical protein
MTAIEKEIYAMLKREKDQWTLQMLTEAYVRAHNSTHRVFRKIDWEKLDAAIKRARGQEGLDHVRRAAVRQQ